MKTKSANVQVVRLSGDRQVCLSYGVPVAAYLPGRGYVKTDRRYSVTTSRHANDFAGRDAPSIPDAELRAAVSEVEGVLQAATAERYAGRGR